MGRPKASNNQKLHAYSLFRQNFPPSAIHKALVEEFEELETPLSLKTVKRWVAEFKTKEEEVAHLDGPFAWHKLEKYGLPWEASAYLLEMWAFVREGKVMSVFPKESRMLSPTVREMIWARRVHLATPDVGMRDVWLLAERFVYRELCHEVLGERLDMADLEAQLAYRPWEGWPDNEERLDIYRRLVGDGRIPALKVP